MVSTLPNNLKKQLPQVAPPKSARIGVIIPVRNRKLLLQSILKQLEEQIASCEENIEQLLIVVVDDGSTDGTSELVAEYFPSVKVVKGDGSLWWTGGIVKGMEYAIARFDPDYFVWLNDDLCLAPDFIECLLKTCNSERYKETMVGGIVTDRTNPEWIVYSGLREGKPLRTFSHFARESELETETLAGNIAIIPRSIVDRVGLPDAKKFPQYGGDFEYVRAVRSKGFKAIVTNKLQGTTDYEVGDVIRYMPYWMQWYLQPNFARRRKIIQGLLDLKSNQNIWLFVNLQHLHSSHIPRWKYVLCYLNKIIKLLFLDLLPRDAIAKKIERYLEEWSVPAPLKEEIQRRQKGI